MCWEIWPLDDFSLQDLLQDNQVIISVHDLTRDRKSCLHIVGLKPDSDEISNILKKYLFRTIENGRKEGNVLFNDALNTFYLQLYGVGHMVKYHSDSERKPAAATWATLSD